MVRSFVRFLSSWSVGGFAVLGLILLLATSAAKAEEEKPKAIKAEEARQHAGEKVSVTFEVKHTKDAQKRNTVFLDSEADFMDEKNLGIAILAAGLKELKDNERIENPADHFLNKTIRVVGTIELREDRPYIDVEKASQIREIVNKE